MSDLLEQQLNSLGDTFDLGDTELLVDDVLRSLAVAPQRASLRQARFRRPLVGIAATLITAFAVPASRHAIAGWLSFGATRIERVPTLPTVTHTAPGVAVQPTPTPSTSGLPTIMDPPTTTVPPIDLGPGLVPATKLNAAQLAGLPVPSLGADLQSHAVFIGQPPAMAQIVVVYPVSSELAPTSIAGVGALLSTVDGIVAQDSFGKFLDPGTSLETVQVVTADGEFVAGLWISGSPHSYGLLTDNGEFRIDTLRLATNTLLWVVDGVQYRLEASIPRDEALHLAATVTSTN